jgi:hypothetical protein
VYFETSSTSPYQIRRIEELNKTSSGNVEAKVMCFYRRRDLPSPLVQLADKHQSEYLLTKLYILLKVFSTLSPGILPTEAKMFKWNWFLLRHFLIKTFNFDNVTKKVLFASSVASRCGHHLFIKI